MIKTYCLFLERTFSKIREEMGQKWLEVMFYTMPNQNSKTDRMIYGSSIQILDLAIR